MIKCKYKTQYNTREEALAKGFKVYLCPHCKKWHRTTDKHYIKNKSAKYKNGWYTIKMNNASIWKSFEEFKLGVKPDLVTKVYSIGQVEKILESL